MPARRKILLALILKLLGLLSSGLGIGSLFLTVNVLPAVILTVTGAMLIIGGVLLRRRVEAR